MDTFNSVHIDDSRSKTLVPQRSTPLRLPAGVRVRSDVRAGDWSCEDCQGEVKGSQMIKASCGYCYHI